MEWNDLPYSMIVPSCAEDDRHVDGVRFLEAESAASAGWRYPSEPQKPLSTRLPPQPTDLQDAPLKLPVHRLSKR